MLEYSEIAYDWITRLILPVKELVVLESIKWKSNFQVENPHY